MKNERIIPPIPMNKLILPLMLLLLFASCNNTRKTQPAATLNAQPSILNSIEPTGNAQIDSLLHLAAVTPQDTVLAGLYYRIAVLYRNNDPQKAKEYYRILDDLSEKLGWSKGRYQSANGISSILAMEVLPDSALTILQKATELAMYENDESWIADLRFQTGYVYFAKRWYEMALTCFMDVLPFYEKSNDVRKLGRFYSTMSQLHSWIYATEKAIEYGEKAVALDGENPYYLTSLAIAYMEAHRYEEAKANFDKALRISESQNDIDHLAFIYYHLSGYALAMFDLDMTEWYVRESMKIKMQFGRDADCCANIATLSKVEQLRGNFGKAEEYAMEALKMAQETEAEVEPLDEMKTVYKILSELALARHQYRENMRYWEEIEKIELIMLHEEMIRAGEEYAAKYETEKKQIEIERQQQVIARQNMQRWLLAGGIAVCVVFLALLWYMLRLRSRRNLALSERSEALSERNEALSEMNATKDKFFSIISHDLRNPVVAQRDALQMLVQNSGSWDVNTLTTYYHELLKSADGQVELIYNLLGWAQLQTGRITYNPSTFNLAHRLRSDIALIRNIAEKKGVGFAVSIPDDADITGDGAMLSIVVRNLLTNAVKFTEGASPPDTPYGKVGTVTLNVTPIDGGDDTRRDAMHCVSTTSIITGYIIAISDTGIGMSAEQIGNLFRLDSARSRKGTAGEQGSGLGLIVCRELLEKHGSELHVESEEGKGSRFWFKV